MVITIGNSENAEQGASSRPPPKEEAIKAQPSLFEDSKYYRSLRKCRIEI